MAVKRRTWTTSKGITKTCWQVDYYLDGKRIKKGGFKTKLLAEEHLRSVSEESKKPPVDKKLSFKDAANEFMGLHVEIHCKPSTITFYDSMLRNHMIPFFGNMKMYEIKPENINEFIRIKKSEELSNKSINHFLTLLHSIFQKMIENDKLASNPVVKVKRLKLPYKEMQFLKHDEINLLLEATLKYYPDFYPLLMTAIFTGMRKGELLALTWDDINFKTGKIRVDKAIYKGNISTPKSVKGIRKVDMTKTLMQVLKEHKMKNFPGEKNLVFSNVNQNYLDPDNLIKRRFEPLMKKTGLEIRFHDLRHTYASMLIAKNIPIKYIQNQLGHSSIQMTLDQYGHIMPETHEQAVQALESIVQPGKIEEDINSENLAKI